MMMAAALGLKLQKICLANFYQGMYENSQKEEEEDVDVSELM